MLANVEITWKEVDETAFLLYGVEFMRLEDGKKIETICEILKRHLPEGTTITVSGDCISVEVPNVKSP